MRPDKSPIEFSIFKQLFPDGKFPKLYVCICDVYIGITTDNNLFVRCYPRDYDTGDFIINDEYIDSDTYEAYINSFLRKK